MAVGWLLRWFILRLIGFCLLATLGTLLLGRLSQTALVTWYHENEGQRYTMYVEDPAHHLRHPLAGTRCFEALPPWVYPKNKDDKPRGGPDMGRSYPLAENDAALLLRRLDCP